jgi:hypothetical protein
VLARPPIRVNAVSAATRWSPYQRMSAAKAGWYNVPAIAVPMRNHESRKTGKVEPIARSTTAPTASSEPEVITHRGPWRSNCSTKSI